ncbi:hypothetical protein D3C87_676270 [compost metagenome]
MLNRIAIDAAFPVAQRLDERGLRLLPAQNSPLMSLTLSVDNTLVDNSLAENTDIVSVLQSRAGGDAHRVAKADIIRLASASVSRLHDISRNQVLPAIKELAGKVQEYVNARRLEASLPYSVVMKEIPAVFSNPALRQLADRYPNPSQMDYIARNLAPVTLERVKELVKTGMAGFDSELDLCLSLRNDEGYAAVMDVLSAKANVNGINQDYLPGVLVAAQSIYDEPEPGVNLTLVEYNDNVNRLLGRTAQLLRGAMLRYAEQEKLGILYSADGRNSLTQIVVMGKTYRAMLEKGLTPEALIGNEMAARRFTQGQLIENKTILETIYNREMNLQAVKVQTSMAGIVRDALRGVIGTELAARDMGEEAVDANKRLIELTAKVNAANCDDLNTLVTEIVCEVFYPRTDALTFIRLMNRVGSTLAADTDPREVALMATIKYVNFWLCRQLGLAQA